MAETEQPSAPEVLTLETAAKLFRGSRVAFNKLNHAAGELVKVEQESYYAMQRVRQESKLLDCDPYTLRDALLNVASVGLTLNPAHQYATIIPRYNKQRRALEAVLWIMYRGFVKLATDTGLITSVTADNVYKADDFSFTRASAGDDLIHKIAVGVQRDTTEYMGSYCIARLAQDPAHPKIEWVSGEEMLKIMLASDNYDANNKGCVWIKWQGEMQKKAAIKRAQKTWPKSTGSAQDRFQQAVDIDNIIEGVVKGVQPRIAEVPRIALAPAKISKDQVTTLKDLLLEHKRSESALCCIYFIDSLDEMLAENYEEAVKRIKAAKKETKVNG